MKSCGSIFLLLLLFASGGWLSCDTTADQPIPSIRVREEVYLNTIEALPLKNPPNFMYVRGGIRGIVLYTPAIGQYIAFERNCTFQPDRDCAQVRVDPSIFFMVDSCCGARFNFDGQALGPPASAPLRRYSVSQISQDVLLITN